VRIRKKSRTINPVAVELGWNIVNGQPPARFIDNCMVFPFVTSSQAASENPIIATMAMIPAILRIASSLIFFFIQISLKSDTS
jgi:hypothetical protein